MKRSSFLLVLGLGILLLSSSFAYERFTEISKEQVKLVVLYGHPDDPAGFEDYYLNEHAAIAEKMKGMTRIELTKFEKGSDGADPVFYRMAEIYFEDHESMKTFLGSQEVKATLADLPNFATGGVTTVIGTAVDFP